MYGLIDHGLADCFTLVGLSKHVHCTSHLNGMGCIFEEHRLRTMFTVVGIYTSSAK